MATQVFIDYMLQAVVEQGASDLRMIAGKPPRIFVGGEWKELQAEALEPEDTDSMMRQITAERALRELDDEGLAVFGFAYGDNGFFMVGVAKKDGVVSLALSRIGMPPHWTLTRAD